MIEETRLKLMQRFVALKMFHNAEDGRLDIVMVQNEKYVFLQGETGTFSSVWLSKALRLLL